MAAVYCTAPQISCTPRPYCLLLHISVRLPFVIRSFAVQATANDPPIGKMR